MKKVLSVLTILALVLMMGSAAFAESADLSGVWYASMYGIQLTMTLNTDGTYQMEIGAIQEEPDTGIWEQTELGIVMDKGTEEEISLIYDATNNTLEAEGLFYFGREPVPVFEPAAVREDAALEDFTGSWKSDLFSVSGIALSPEESGVSLLWTIEGEKVSLTYIFGEDSQTEEFDAAFENGALVWNEAADEESEGAVYTAQMLEDGSMRIVMTMTDTEMIMYLSAAE